MVKRFLVYGLLFPAMLLYCCANSAGGEQTGTSYGSVAPPMGDQLKFKKFTYTDQMGTGLEAFSFLMPSDWQFEGGITWLLDLPMMPARAAFRVYDPKGKAAFVSYPNHCFYWAQDPTTSALFPPGSKYFGMEIKQPMSALDALQYIVLPQARGRVEILKAEPVPELAKLVGAGAQGAADGAKVRFKFYDGSAMVEEELYGVVEVIPIPVQTMYGYIYNYLWYVDYLFSFQGEVGKLESYTKTFQTISSSFKVNPKWYAKYSNMIEYLAQKQIEHIHSIGEMSRMLSQMSDQMRQENLQQFEERGRVYDKTSQAFGDYMLNIDRYYDPFEGKEVELPSGYNHAWVNNNGEYILTDNPNFNPNEGSNLHWEVLPKKGP
ncbi:MAG: hypothetical protein IPL49_19740 [Saprospirales bacterium]|nr:hypothetical protein [Saprospirales bacterium]MBK8493051.1 hypothetical protein [Saprospirales bacterium]